MNKLIESKYLHDKSLTYRSYARVGELSNNIIDQLYFLQDVLNIQVDCVNEFLKEVLMKEFVVKYCFEQLLLSFNQLPPSSPV